MTRAIGVEVGCPFTPAVLRKVVYAGTHAPFAQATQDLDALAEVKVSREQVQRWTKRVGEERLADVAEQAQAYQTLPLPARQQSPTGQIPQVACVQMDGGRIQIRDRHEGSQDRDDRHGFWRESRVGCCLSMTSQEHTVDPCPTIPPTFVDPAKMHDLSREIKGFSGDPQATEGVPEEAPQDWAGPPQVLVRSVVATRGDVEAFGELLVAEAHARGFHAARRKAFVADGSATNWGVHRKHFSRYTPVLDFTHAICYVHAAAMAGRNGGAGWRDYCQWAQWLWSGNTAELIAAVAGRSGELGPPGKGDETSPAAIVAKTLVYLQNQRSRMNYPKYRKLGLPITSSHIESTIKQINRRVKGTEKFWDQGASPILQLAADHLSQTPAPDRFWKTRQHRLSSTRRYQATQTAA